MAKNLAKVTQSGNAGAESQVRVTSLCSPHLCFNCQAQGAASHADQGREHQPKVLGASQAIPSTSPPMRKGE